MNIKKLHGLNEDGTTFEVFVSAPSVNFVRRASIRQRGNAIVAVESRGTLFAVRETVDDLLEMFPHLNMVISEDGDGHGDEEEFNLYVNFDSVTTVQPVNGVAAVFLRDGSMLRIKNLPAASRSARSDFVSHAECVAG
ncbi:MAG TPA: hypothetical protein VEC35_09440 [Noviherbaspirillum sp.]|nr:hypothetical protein [Noviherbaspirillum sp.]